jgi:hypothetical protein
VATCLANLRFISQAASSYVQEHGTLVFVFPWDYVIWSDGYYDPGFHLATEFIWGGGVPDKRRGEWDESWGPNPVTLQTDTYCITPADRPLNEYMVPGVWWSHPDRIQGRPERYQIPMELPDFFKCPADSSPVAPFAGVPADPNSMVYDPNNPSWAWWGTSYAINWYWATFYTEMGVALIGTTSSPGVLDGDRHRQILQSKLDHGASEWPLFYENGMNFALQAARPRDLAHDMPPLLPGWHGHESTHAAGFADGSARYRRFETQYVDGPGWTLWPSRPWDGTPWEPYQDY